MSQAVVTRFGTLVLTFILMPLQHIIFFLARVCYTMQFEVGSEEVDKVKPKRPPPPPPKPQPPPRAKGPKQPPSEEVPGTSA